MSASDEKRRAQRAQQQRERRATKRARDAFWKDTFGPLPDYFKEFAASIKPNTTPEALAASMAQRESWEKAPGHLQDRTREDGGFDDLAVKKLAHEGGQARGACSASEAQETSSALRSRYPQFVGKRGAAKEVYRLERRRLDGVETKDDKIPSIRTLQKIFRDWAG